MEISEITILEKGREHYDKLVENRRKAEEEKRLKD
jgi:hypothetical protein